MATVEQQRTLDFVRSVILENKEIPGPLLVVLHRIQKELQCIPTDAVPVIAEGLNLSRAEVHGVISFYHFFRSVPAGRHIVQICRAEACQAMGSRKLEMHAKHALGIEFNQTTSDGHITLEPVYCLGNCACAPAIRVGDEVYAHVDEVAFDSIVNELTTEKLEVR